jgi:hypothetical protein
MGFQDAYYLVPSGPVWIEAVLILLSLMLLYGSLLRWEIVEEIAGFNFLTRICGRKTARLLSVLISLVVLAFCVARVLA